MRTLSTTMLSQGSQLVDARMSESTCSSIPVHSSTVAPSTVHGTWRTTTAANDLAASALICTTAVHFATKGMAFNATKPYAQRPKETLR